MKLILIATTLVFMACSKQAQDPDPMKESAAPQGIVEENNVCICTKEFRPVCGSNGVTYGNKCLAGCEGIKEFTPGTCEK